MNILILTGKFGMGHWSASQSLRQQLLRAFPGAEVEVLDFVAEAMPNASEAMYKCFNLLVTRGSGLFNLYYKLTQDLPADARPLFETLFLDKLEELVAARRPDAVIATHPLCARMVSRWKGETGSALPLITCVTDLSSHSEWIHKYTDCYLVGSNDIRSRLAAKGVDRDIICVTGIPVRCEFKRPVRRRPGRERNLLIMGGGLGLLPKRDSFYEALDALPGVHTTIITGNNRKLYDRLAGKYAHIEVLGFTDRVYDYMARADLVVVGGPYWDLGFPAALKVYLEWACTLGITFGYTQAGEQRGLCRAERLIYITTAGGPLEDRNFGYEYVRGVAGMLGIINTHCVAAQGLDIRGNDPEAILREAQERAARLAAEI